MQRGLDRLGRALLGAIASAALIGSASAAERLTLLVPNNPAFLQPAIDAFNAANPDLEVVQESVPFDTYSDILQTRMSTHDSSLDLLVVDQPRSAAYSARGFLVDLTADYLPEAKGKLFDAAIAASIVNGKLWSGAFWESSNNLWYNKTLLDQAGVAAPPNDTGQRWTWEQLVAAAKQVQAKTGAPCGILFDQTDRYYQLQPLIESAGGGTGLTGEGNLTVNIENDGWIKAMTFYQDLFKDGVTPPSVDADQARPYFVGGKCAFFVGISIVAGQLDGSFAYGIAPMPYFEGGEPVTPNAANALGISSLSTKKDAAMRFLKFLTLDAVGNGLAVSVVPLPAANIEAQKREFADLEAKSAALKGLGALIEYELSHTARARPETIGYTQFEAAFLRAAGDIRNGTDVKQALATMRVELEAAFQQLQ